jgi:hypothetical protein
MRKKGFPIFATVILVLATIWLLNDLNVIYINIPFIPIVLIIFSIGVIINRYRN